MHTTSARTALFIEKKESNLNLKEGSFSWMINTVETYTTKNS